MSFSSIGIIAAWAREVRHDLQSGCESQAFDRKRGRVSLVAIAAFGFASLFIFYAKETFAVTPIEITPHRAAYLFEMVLSEPGGGVSGVTGGMTFEWADACDGWALDQHYLLQISNTDGSRTEIRTSSVTWEAKDGLRYRFNVKRGRDGKLTEDLRGDARLESVGGGGVAEFSKPKSAKIELPTGTKFPTDFMLGQMQAASEGLRMEQTLVFEGGVMGGPQSVTTMFLPRRAPREKGVLEAPLGPDDVWPMYVAYFPLDQPDGNAETELSLDVQPNGIVPSFVLDYGAFKLRGVLARVAALPDPGC